MEEVESPRSGRSSAEKFDDPQDCAICLLPCLQPVQLPCRHVFCFLCAKGTALQSRKCALCRSDIPDDFLVKPSLFVAKSVTGKSPAAEPVEEESYAWFYAGMNGWWQYDVRTTAEIEAAHERGDAHVQVLIAGALYTVDFGAGVQYQANRNSRKRAIKRDRVGVAKKGVAGIPIDDDRSAPCSSGSAPVDCDAVAPRRVPLGADSLTHAVASLRPPSAPSTDGDGDD